MDQSRIAESEHGVRADCTLYLRLLLWWNVLRALFTAKALLHSSYSFSGSCGGCRNNEIIMPIIPSNSGNETAFITCSRQAWTVLFHQQSDLSGGSQAVSAEVAAGCSLGGTKTAADPGYPHTAEILWLGNTESPTCPHSLQNTLCVLLGWGSSGNADSRWEGIKFRLRRGSGPPELRFIPVNTQLKSA